MSDQPLYQSGSYSVSRQLISTHRHDWKVSEVVAVEVSRLPFWSALMIASAGLLMIWGLQPILYLHETLIGLVVMGLIAGIGSQTAILRVSMEALRGTETGQVIGWHRTLAAMRCAIRTVLTEQERGR
jgi:hypothetical protein